MQNDFKHAPVMLKECIKYLDINENGVYVDGTAGGAGHSAEIYKKLGAKGLLIGIDQDINAINAADKKLSLINANGCYKLENTNFENIKEVLYKNDIKGIDGILLDLGVSSHQLDEGSRGFSYTKSARLDMRMNTDAKLDAEYVINNYTKENLTKIIREYGEEKWASRITSFIVRDREEKKIETTDQLANLIRNAIPAGARRKGGNPAKRTFQAIRIEVNNELGVLKTALEDITESMNKGGKICIITFHSLEDRIVKNFFRKKANPCTCPSSFPICICGEKPELKIITRKPILSTEEELEENNRAKSAKLRVAEKI